MDNFDLKKYLTENKLTSNSKLDEIGDASAEAYKWEALPKSEAGEETFSTPINFHHRQ